MPTKRLPATRLRAELFRTLDEVIATGEAVEVRRSAGTVRLVPSTGDSRLTRLRPQADRVVGDAADLAGLTWPEVWRPTL